jgi:hypothetical protein
LAGTTGSAIYLTVSLEMYPIDYVEKKEVPQRVPSTPGTIKNISRKRGTLHKTYNYKSPTSKKSS